VSCGLEFKIVILARGWDGPLVVNINSLVVNEKSSQFAVGEGVIVSVCVGVKVLEAVGELVKVLEGVKVGVMEKVMDGVGDPINGPGGRLCARDTRNFSTTPRCAETRWIIGQT
jgi:hypothetical protein